MPANRNTQRRHQQSDDSRRGHPLQHRDQDEGWADRGTWSNLHNDSRGHLESELNEHDAERGSTVDESAVRQLSPSQRHHQSTQRSDVASGFGSEPKGNNNRRDTRDRAPGGGGGTTVYKSQGNPRTGSQRGDDSNQGITGHPGKQFGDLHGPRPSTSQAAGYHEDDNFGGRRGHSTRDEQYGSRHGHGSRRREDPRTQSQ